MTGSADLEKETQRHVNYKRVCKVMLFYFHEMDTFCYVYKCPRNKFRSGQAKKESHLNPSHNLPTLS